MAIISYSSQMTTLTNQPLISVIIASYNRFEALQKAVESACKQTYTHLEIIVINDCSTDQRYNSLSFKDSRVQLLHLKENSSKKLGFASAGYVRNRGIEQSKGTYIAILDDDDYWFSGKIENQLKKLEQTQLEICATEAVVGSGLFQKEKQKYYVPYHHVFHRNSRKRQSKRDQLEWEKGKIPSIIIPKYLKTRNIIIHSSVLFKKTLLEKTGLYPEIDIKGSLSQTGTKLFEDYELLKKILQHSNCAYINSPQLYYQERFLNSKQRVRFFKKQLLHLLCKF